MAYHRSIHPQKNSQQGITLIEALIALFILALGVLGLAQVEARMLAETRTSNSRATAIQLIADLRDRINMNAAGAQLIGADGLILYSDPAAPGTPGSFSGAVTCGDPTTLACCDPTTAVCSAQQLVSYDLSTWRQEVTNSLLNGKASIYQVRPNQLQVIIAWQLNENTNITVNGPSTSAAQQLASPLQITGTDQTTNLCSDGTQQNLWICHIDFIDIPTS